VKICAEPFNANQIKMLVEFPRDCETWPNLRTAQEPQTKHALPTTGTCPDYLIARAKGSSRSTMPTGKHQYSIDSIS